MQRSHVRSTISDLVRRAGMSGLLRFVHRNAIIILMLHGVMDDDLSTAWTPLRPQLPRKQLKAALEMLSRRYTFVSLADAVGMLTGQAPLRPYSLALTFDDGYRNQLKCALPILEAYRAPMTVFLATGHIDQRKPFWFDRLDYALQHVRVAGREFEVGNRKVRFASDHRDELRRSFKRLRDAAKMICRPDTLMTREMEALAELLEEECGRRLTDIFEHDHWTSLLSWQEVREACRHPLITFGSHTVDHMRLGLATDGEIHHQVKASKNAIERATGRECRFFCFPSGSFSLECLNALQSCGYAAAVTTLEGVNAPGDHPLTLRRVSLPFSEARMDILPQTIFPSQLARTFSRPRNRHSSVECILGN